MKKTFIDYAFEVLIFILFFLFFIGLAYRMGADSKPKAVTKVVPVYKIIVINSPQEIDEPVLTEATKVEEIPSEEETIDEFVDDIVLKYPNVSSSLVKSVIWHESRYNPEAVNYNETCFGLMQTSSYWHKDRMERLGVKDLFDPYGNILVGVDYLSELIDKYEDPALALMLYNMRHDTAFKLYKQGKISDYAKSVIERATQL